MSISLRVIEMLSASAAGAGAAIPLDYRYDGNQNRTIFVTAITAGDTIQLEVSTDGSTWVNLGSAITAVGTTSISGPYPFIRANKTGTAGTATVIGVI